MSRLIILLYIYIFERSIIFIFIGFISCLFEFENIWSAGFLLYPNLLRIFSIYAKFYLYFSWFWHHGSDYLVIYVNVERNPMGFNGETLEENLTSLFGQLQFECGIFERIVYKSKNQHRRCSYFQYPLKVYSFYLYVYAFPIC